jgi:hypothetical protein
MYRKVNINPVNDKYFILKNTAEGQTGQPTAGATDIPPGAGTAHPDGHYAREATIGGRRDERRKHAGRFYIIFYSVIIIYKEKCLYLGEIKRGYGESPLVSESCRKLVNKRVYFRLTFSLNKLITFNHECSEIDGGPGTSPPG